MLVTIISYITFLQLLARLLSKALLSFFEKPFLEHMFTSIEVESKHNMNELANELPVFSIT
jgi:hypothetical protein